MNWRLPRLADPHYPAGVSDNDPNFDLPNADGGKIGKRQPPKPPATTMVYCSLCMRHWEAPAREDYWNARTELCPTHQRMADEGVTEEDIAETRYPTRWPENR